MSQVDAEFVYFYVVDTRMSYSVDALIIYESTFTFSQEVSMIWCRKFSMASALFLLARWNLLVGPILDIFSIVFPDTPSNCKASNVKTVLDQCIFVLAFLQTAVFSALRAAAIWNRSWKVFWTIFLLESVPVATNIFGSTRAGVTYYHLPSGMSPVCIIGDSVSPTLNEIMLLVTRIPPILGDVMVIIITVVKTFRLRREALRLRIRSPLSEILLYHGAAYFIVLLGLNLCRIFIYYERNAPINSFLDALPSILICRFILCLRQATDDNSSSDSRIPESTGSDVRFRVPVSILNSMAGPLDHSLPRDYEDLPADGGDIQDVGQTGITGNDIEGIPALPVPEEP